MRAPDPTRPLAVFRSEKFQFDGHNVVTVMRDQVLKGDLDPTDGILTPRDAWNGDALAFPALQHSPGERRVVRPESLETSNAHIGQAQFGER